MAPIHYIKQKTSDMVDIVKDDAVGEEAKLHMQVSSIHQVKAADDADLPRVALRVGSENLHEGSEGSFRHISPVTGRPQATVPLAGAHEVRLAVDSASAAAPVWRAQTPQARRDLLLRLAAAVDAHTDEFARINAIETGTPTGLGRMLVQGAKEWISYYAGWVDKLEGTVHNAVANTGTLAFSQPEPYGVVGIIFPWNNPIASIGMKVIPALAAGNTVVVKPSEMAPFAVEYFAQLCDEVGFPPGVLTVVPGTSEAGNALVLDPRVELISFTGGPETGRQILAACATQLKPTIMELGGKSPNIVFDDADLDRAAAQVIRSLGVLSGQACVFGSRILVQEAVYDEFVERLTRLADGMRAGDPADASTVLGPVISEQAQDRILGVIDRAIAGEGKLLSGGRKLEGDLSGGFYIAPTIIGEVDNDAEITQKETFGPVISVYRFASEDEAIEIANSTAFGLGAYVQTADISRALRVSSRLKSGGVYINGGPSVMANLPFGGIGDSGFGREGARAGIEEYLRLKTVSVGSIV